MTTTTEDTVCYSLAGINIDTTKLLEDYHRVAGGSWTDQNRYMKESKNNWNGISVYSINGESDDLRCADRAITKKTPAGENCPYICEDLLPQFDAPLLRVAFYRLKSGTVVGRHKDYGQNRTMGSVRIHIPVITNPEVTMRVSDNQYHFAVGEAWYFDASCWHSVQNKGSEDRIHLIADFCPSAGLDAHLKPIGMNDRVRFLKARMENYGAVTSAFFDFVRTKEGRERIKNRLAVIMNRQPTT